MQPAYEFIYHGGPVRTKHEHPYAYDPIRHFHTRACGEVESCYSDRMQSWDYKKWRNCVRDMNANHGGVHAWSFTNKNHVQEFLRLYYSAPDLVLLDLIEWCNVATGYTLYSFAFIRVVDDSKPLSPAQPPVPAWATKIPVLNIYGSYGGWDA